MAHFVPALATGYAGPDCDDRRNRFEPNHDRRGTDYQRMRPTATVIGIREVDPDRQVANVHLTLLRGIKGDLFPDELLGPTLLVYDLRHDHPAFSYR
jgi:hypothetical protein